LSLQTVVREWKRDTVSNMAQCYQIMRDYDESTTRRSILSLNLCEKKGVDLEDLMLYAIMLSKCKTNNVELQSSAVEISYSITSHIIEQDLWSPTDKATVEFLLQTLITSDHLSDDQRCHLLNIGGGDDVDGQGPAERPSISIDPAAVISRVRSSAKMLQSVLQNAISSGHVNSTATNILVSILRSPPTSDLLKYEEVIRCCHHITAYHHRFSTKNQGSNDTEAFQRAMANLDHIAETAITRLVQELQRCLFADSAFVSGREQEVHSFLDLISDAKLPGLPQKWRQCRVIITGIDIVYKYLNRITSPSLGNGLTAGSTVMVRLRIHLLSVLFLLLEHWTINKESEMLFQHSHFSLLEEFVMKWIRETDDAVEFGQVVTDKDIETVISWPLPIQMAYFGKILLSPFLHREAYCQSIKDALKIIKHVLKYPILLNEDGTAEQQQNPNRIDFEFKKKYLLLVQKALQKPAQKSKIIEQFSGVLLGRLRFATFSKEQVVLLRLLCLFQKNSRNQAQRDKITRNVKDIYDDGKLANLTTQSYVDLLLQSDSTATTTSTAMRSIASVNTI